MFVVQKKIEYGNKIYGANMKCPRCSEDNFVKNGISFGKQRYYCKVCGNNFTVELKSTAKLTLFRKV